MKNKQLKCKACGNEQVNPKMKRCPNCQAKLPTPIFKKWWFWVIIVVVVAVIGSGMGSAEPSENGGSNGSPSTEQYEVVDIDTMIEALEQNALKAEKEYQNKKVEITGKIASFDSDGSYITIESVNAGQWNFDTIMCYIKNDEQREFLMNKSKGDTITVKGKITSVGEVLGYSINIDSVK